MARQQQRVVPASCLRPRPPQLLHQLPVMQQQLVVVPQQPQQLKQQQEQVGSQVQDRAWLLQQPPPPLPLPCHLLLPRAPIRVRPQVHCQAYCLAHGRLYCQVHCLQLLCLQLVSQVQQLQGRQQCVQLSRRLPPSLCLRQGPRHPHPVWRMQPGG